jgi:predicted esterase
MLLFAGSQDCTAPVPQSQRMKKALEAAGVPAELTVIDSGHATAAYYTTPALRQQVLDFLDRQLRL